MSIPTFTNKLGRNRKMNTAHDVFYASKVGGGVTRYQDSLHMNIITDKNNYQHVFKIISKALYSSTPNCFNTVEIIENADIELGDNWVKNMPYLKEIRNSNISVGNFVIASTDFWYFFEGCDSLEYVDELNINISPDLTPSTIYIYGKNNMTLICGFCTAASYNFSTFSKIDLTSFANALEETTNGYTISIHPSNTDSYNRWKPILESKGYTVAISGGSE